MRPKACTAVNFASYVSLEFNFENLGLTLVSGQTGSGKSTLADLVPWTLYGMTSKGGSADDIRSWGCQEPTSVTLEVELPDGDITVTRIRGKAAQNDLYWIEATDPDAKVRGKDAVDTQKLLNTRLGVDADLFILGSFFGQFSDTDRFFTAKAKERREVLERIADLSTAVKLGEGSSEARKVAKKTLEALETEFARTTGSLDQLVAHQHTMSVEGDRWELAKQAKIVDLKAQADRFEIEKAEKFQAALDELLLLDSKLQSSEEIAAEIAKVRAKKDGLAKVRADHQVALQAVYELKSRIASAERDKAKEEKATDTCPTCSRPGANPDRESRIAAAQRGIDDLTVSLNTAKAKVEKLEAVTKTEAQIEKAHYQLISQQTENNRLIATWEAKKVALQAIDDSSNTYLDRLSEAEKAENPYTTQLLSAASQVKAVADKLSQISASRNAATLHVSYLSTLYDLSFVLRGELLRNAVAELEQETNRRLEKYFDAAFRVRFSVEDADKLDVEIFKDEFVVPFKSLSGGQRRLLVLSFSMAMMKAAANKAGVSFSLLTFDEAMNGLDGGLKASALRMFEELTEDAESVILIEHDEGVKASVQNRYEVKLVGQTSVIESVVESEAVA